jgi:hypothetical protein
MEEEEITAEGNSKKDIDLFTTKQIGYLSRYPFSLSNICHNIINLPPKEPSFELCTHLK